MVEWPWRYRSRSKVITRHTASHVTMVTQPPIDFIYRCPFFKWVTVTWLKHTEPRQNAYHFADDTFKHFFLNDVKISIEISLKLVPKGPINNSLALVQIMAWCRPGNKPLSDPMILSLVTHICVTQSQWVKIGNQNIWRFSQQWLPGLHTRLWFFSFPDKCGVHNGSLRGGLTVILGISEIRRDYLAIIHSIFRDTCNYTELEMSSRQ